jgi:hypothetical protein
MPTTTVQSQSAQPRHTHSAQSIIASSGLPEPLCNRVHEVVSQLRLWPSERASVAKELCAHFADGLAQGETPEALLQTFGDARQSARMMTRAKRRLRPTWWKLSALSAQAFAGVLACGALAYGVLWVQAATARPTITIDFVAQYNANTERVPQEQRAWPLYTKALAALPTLDQAVLRAGFPAIAPGTPEWSLASDYATKHAESLRLVREAAQRPALGMPLSAEIVHITRPDVAAPTLPTTSDSTLSPSLAGGLLNVKLPHLGALRELARLLAFDATRAAHEGDLETAGENLDAMLGLAGHAAGEDDLLIGQLVGASIAALAAQTNHTIVTTYAPPPDWLLARANSFARGAEHFATLRLQGEVDGLHDLLQRAFTDDGKGNGRLAITHREWLVLMGQASDTRENALDRVLSPVRRLNTPTRFELQRDHDAIFAQFAQVQSLPLSEARALLAKSPLSLSTEYAQGPRRAFLRSLVSMKLSHARLAATSFALTRLASGEQGPPLAPPLDPWTGKPMLTSSPTPGTLIVYSAGEDGDDDNATPVNPSLPPLSLDPHSSDNTPREGDLIYFGPG